MCHVFFSWLNKNKNIDFISIEFRLLMSKLKTRRIILCHILFLILQTTVWYKWHTLIPSKLLYIILLLSTFKIRYINIEYFQIFCYFIYCMFQIIFRIFNVFQNKWSINIMFNGILGLSAFSVFYIVWIVYYLYVCSYLNLNSVCLVFFVGLEIRKY